MENKILKARVLLRSDTQANWNARDDFKPAKGEVCIYLDRTFYYNEENKKVYIPGIKIGDGESYINELEFVGEDFISEEMIDELFNNKN